MRFNLDTIDKLRYISIPTELFTNPKYATLDIMSKAIYGVLKSRMNLSKANSWVEDNGDIFFYMPIDELSKMLTTSKATISRKLQELENVGLLERQHLASSRCHRMYLHQVESQAQIDENICENYQIKDEEYNSTIPALNYTAGTQNDSDEAIVAHSEARVTPVQLRVSSMQPIYNTEILKNNTSLNNNNNRYTNNVDVENFSETHKDNLNLIKFLKNIGIAAHTVNVICQKYSIERIKTAINILKKQTNIRNGAGFIIAALRFNYQPPKNLDAFSKPDDSCQYIPVSRPAPDLESPEFIAGMKKTIEQLFERRGAILTPYKTWLENHGLAIDKTTGKIIAIA